MSLCELGAKFLLAATVARIEDRAEHLNAFFREELLQNRMIVPTDTEKSPSGSPASRTTRNGDGIDGFIAIYIDELDDNRINNGIDNQILQ